MKKITFLAFLFAISLNAQTYCTVSEDFEGIEEITSITFSDASISNSSNESIWLDFTSTVANVIQDETYRITVQGNSVGNYDNEYVAYIDWNQNGVLNDVGEIFYIGLIIDSDGNDGKTAFVDINIPSNATIGNTRIRVFKVYTDEADDFILNFDPCWVSIEDVFYGSFDDFYPSYGQVIDFTLNISTLSTDSFNKKDLTIYPNPVKDVLTISSDNLIEQIAIYNIQGQLVLENKNTNEINTSSLPIGQYVLKASSNGIKSTKKFVKQ
jgi:hypothetical protein